MAADSIQQQAGLITDETLAMLAHVIERKLWTNE